jgi:hypothetical protein
METSTAKKTAQGVYVCTRCGLKFTACTCYDTDPDDYIQDDYDNGREDQDDLD